MIDFARSMIIWSTHSFIWSIITSNRPRGCGASNAASAQRCCRKSPTAGRVLNLFVDNTIPGTTPFSAVKEKAFSLLELGRFTAVTDYLQNIAFDKTGFEWSYYTAFIAQI